MPENKRRAARSVLGGALLATLVGSVAAGAPANAATTSQDRAGKPKDCVVVLKEGGGVKSARCSDNPAELKTMKAKSTLLMTLYDKSGYGGDNTQIRGNGGGCDRTGYGFRDLDEWLGLSWNNYTSSFKTWNGCTAINAHTSTNYGGSAAHYTAAPGDGGSWIASLSAEMNNNIESFFIWRK